jgi:hypothetical protein
MSKYQLLLFQRKLLIVELIYLMKLLHGKQNVEEHITIFTNNQYFLVSTHADINEYTVSPSNTRYFYLRFRETFWNNLIQIKVYLGLFIFGFIIHGPK